MSHIGKEPIKLPINVKFKLEKDNVIFQGKEGELKRKLPFFLEVLEENGNLYVNIKKEYQHLKEYISMWGTYRTLLQNMVLGVNQGFTVKLLLVGIGFRSKVENNNLNLKLGFSHYIDYIIPENIKITCIKPTLIAIYGIDKELVTKVAAEIRALKKTEPYKGKGIRYLNETIRSKEAKKK